MNDDTIQARGKTYHYDPDRDCYYAVTEESTVSRWSWLIVGIVLAAVCWHLDT